LCVLPLHAKPPLAVDWSRPHYSQTFPLLPSSPQKFRHPQVCGSIDRLLSGGVESGGGGGGGGEGQCDE
jgi:hypothetical protein